MKDGGPAFPCTIYTDPSPYRSGMSLRDYFAAAAIGKIDIAPWLHPQSKTFWQDAIDKEVENAYLIADAMLAEREKTKETA